MIRWDLLHVGKVGSGENVGGFLCILKWVESVIPNVTLTDWLADNTITNGSEADQKSKRRGSDQRMCTFKQGKQK